MTAPTPPQGPAQGGPQGPQHFTPPPAEPVSQSSARKNLVIAGVLAGGGCLLVILVVIALIIYFAVRGGDSGGGGGETGAADLPPEEQATALVADYFDALAAGDAATALELNPVNEDMGAAPLPVEAYTAALEAAPITGVELGTPVIDDGGLAEGEVPVTFTVGDETVSDTYRVHDYDDDGVMELTGGTGYDDIVVLAPSAEVLAEAANMLAPGGVMNIFAGLPRGTKAPIDLKGIVVHGVRFTGTSGSSIRDLRSVLDEAEAGRLDPNLSVVAVSGLNDAKKGLEGVMHQAFPGKVVVYPQIVDFPLTALPDLADVLPSVYAKLGPNHSWTVEAEAAFLEELL